MPCEQTQKIDLSNGCIWMVNKEIHRLDGPAIERNDGFVAWWVYGKEYSFKDWLKLCSLSQEEKCELVLIYG